MILPNARTTAVRAPDLTPRTLIQVRTASSQDDRQPPGPTPWLAPSQRYPTAREKKTDRLAIDAMRAIQVIQPTSKPTNSPNAARV